MMVATPKQHGDSADPAKHIEPHILHRMDPDFVAYYVDTVLKGTPIRAATIEDLRREPAKYRTLIALDSSQGVARVTEHTLTSETDGGTFPVRLYLPDPTEHGAGPYPLHLNFHGGGFVQGDLYCEAQLCLSMREAGVAVLDVGYRHCPEVVWGRCFEDAWAALTWARSTPLNILPDSISVGGVSAGGHISLVLQQRARDEHIPLRLVLATVPPAAGSLFYRYYSDSPHPSFLEMSHSPILPWPRIQFYANLCLASTKPRVAGQPLPTTVADEADRQACIARLREQWPAAWIEPLSLADWRGLAPLYLRSAELDNIRDEGEAYAHAMVAGGTTVMVKRYVGAVHTFMYHDFLASKRTFDADSIVALRQAHGLAPLSAAAVAAKVDTVIAACRAKRTQDKEAGLV